MADGISMPNVDKIGLSKIKELELVIDSFGKEAKREDLEGWATAVSLHALKCAGGKMSLQKIRTLTRAFNKTTATYGTLRFLILIALLGSPSIHTIAIRGVNYKTHIETYLPEKVCLSKRVTERSIFLKGKTQDGHLAVSKVIGRRSTGFCRCCVDHEVDVLEDKNIIAIKDISKIEFDQKQQALSVTS